MVDRQENKFGMFVAVKLNLNNHKSLWENRPYFVTNVNALSATIDAIRKENLIATGNKKGYTIAKQESRTKLEESTILVVNIMRSYAAFIKDNVLLEQVHYTASMLKNSAGKALIIDTGVIHGIATTHLAGASNFGLTQGFLDELMANNLDFLKKLNYPADQFRLKKEAKVKLQQLISEGDRILKENIDFDMSVFKKNDSLFYETHFNCRKIVDTPVIKLAIRLQILDAESKEPIPKALVTIKDHSIKRKSSPRGAMRIRHLKEGNHTVKISMKGYVSQDIPVTHTAGETTFMRVEMVKDG